MNVNKRILLFCAFKYSLGRMTYVVGAVVDEIKDAWNDLPKGQKENYHKEIKEAMAKGQAGRDMDVKKWQEILELK